MGQGLVLQVGRYGLFGPMAAGGMAEVHFGRMIGEGGFQKTVAIKRLLPHVAKNPECRTMIYEEARLAARIRHPNVVQPLDVIATDDEVLLAMEYVHGEALSKLIMRARKRAEIVPAGVGMAIVCDMLQGLHAAHEARDEQGDPLGIVHRDVSPQNVMVGVDGVARVIDFGIAKAVNSSEFTAAGHVKGKLPYLAPEQFAGSNATRASDIYAAGCVAWEILVGRRLFDGDSEQAVAARILRAPVERPSAFVNDVPPELDDIILRSVDRAPENRWPTAREMALAIEAALPLARASLVGEWVTHLAGPELQKRAARLAEVERLPFELTTPPVSRRSQTSEGRAPPPSRGVAPPLPPPPQVAPPPMAPPPMAPPPMAPPPPAVSAPPPPASMRPAWRSEVKPPKAGEIAKPAVEIPNVNWLPPQADYKAIVVTKRKVGGTAMMLVVVLLAIVGFVFALPTIVRRGYEKSAAAQGVALQIGETEVTQHHVKLLDVRLAMPELPWFSAKATAIEVELSGLDAAAITVRGLDVTVSGSLAELDREVTKWRAVHNVSRTEESDGVRRPKVTVEGARVTWKGALGKATTLVAENVTVEAFGDQEKTTASAPIVTVQSTSGAHAGPFRAAYERTPLATQVWLKLDPNAAKSTSIVLTLESSGGASLDVAVPRSTAGELWLPPSMGIQWVTLNIQARLYPGGKSDGRVDGLLVTSQNQELRLNAALGLADPRSPGPLAISQGTADLGGLRLRPGGTLSFGSFGVDLSLFASCEGAPDVHVLDAVLDTKDVSEAGRLAISGARCGRGGR